jgi:hypothetical protein
MRLCLAVAALLLSPALLAAAPGQPAPVANKMAPLANLVGEWRGSGWMMLPDGTRQPFESRETVTKRLSGAALLVEGRHWQPGKPDALVHDAMAMLTWDSRANAYRFRSALASGMSGDFPLEVGPDRFSWRMDLPGGTRIEYTTDFSGGTWRERGRRIAADGTATDFFEMTLKRQ